MVYRGPSEGCRPCRKRKVKCPANKPFCWNCIKRKATHICVYDKAPSQADAEEWPMLTPDTTNGSQGSHSHSHQSPPWLSSVGETLGPDSRDQALSFFNTFFIRGPREQHTNIWAEQIIPRVAKASPDSVLALSTIAVAMQTLEKERRGIMRSSGALKFYLKAVNAMRTLLTSSLEAHYEEILCGILMLETFENLSNIAGESEYTAVHQNAGLRTVRHGLSLKLDATKSTKTIAAALQSRYVWSCFSVGAPAPLFTVENRSYPGVGGVLDNHAAEAANILHERNLLLTASTPSPTGLPSPVPSARSTTDDPTAATSALLLRTIRLLDALQTWHANLPLSWRPVRLPATSPDLDLSIHAAGLYASLCDVYSSLATSHGMAMYRLLRISALQTRWLLERRLAALSNLNNSYSPSPSGTTATSLPNTTTTTAATEDAAAALSGPDSQPEIQTLVDAICAAVPFHLGNRLPGAILSATQTKYPASPLRQRKLARFVDEHGRPSIMTDAAHAAEAAAKGGFMILVPLSLLLGLFGGGAALLQQQQRKDEEKEEGNAFRLREGQLQWIEAQVARAAAIQMRPSVG